jgi:hypothetical protein
VDLNFCAGAAREHDDRRGDFRSRSSGSRAVAALIRVNAAR